jgi:hypothetical protein
MTFGVAQFFRDWAGPFCCRVRDISPPHFRRVLSRMGKIVELRKLAKLCDRLANETTDHEIFVELNRLNRLLDESARKLEQAAAIASISRRRHKVKPTDA